MTSELRFEETKDSGKNVLDRGLSKGNVAEGRKSLGAWESEGWHAVVNVETGS